MTTDQTAVDLLKRAESYLSALHGSVAPHDNLAAGLGCAGCELRDQINAALPTLTAPASVQPPATRADTPDDGPSHRAGLRDRIRRAVCEAEGFAWDSDMLEPDEYGEHADTVLAVLYREWPWLRAEAEDAALRRMAGEEQPPATRADDEVELKARAALARVRAIAERAAHNVQRPAARLARRILAELPDPDVCPPRCPCHKAAAVARQDGAQPS